MQLVTMVLSLFISALVVESSTWVGWMSHPNCGQPFPFLFHPATLLYGVLYPTHHWWAPHVVMDHRWLRSRCRQWQPRVK